MGYSAAAQGTWPFVDTTTWEYLSSSKSGISKSGLWIYAYFLVMFTQEILKGQDMKDEVSDGLQRAGERKGHVQKVYSFSLLTLSCK